MLSLGLLLLTVLQAAAGETRPSLQDGMGIEQRLDQQVPLNLAFRNDKNATIALSELFTDKPVILVLAYYRCPRLCSLVLSGLVDSLRTIEYEAGKEFVVIVVSIDPREKPDLAAAKKASYVERYGRPGSAESWHFLTGQEEAIERLAEAVGFRYSYDAATDQFAHASGIMVLTPKGKISRYLYGLEFPGRDLRFALEDASSGRIGSPISQPLRLLCFAYDPATGRYTFLAMRLIRVAGGVTVLILLGVLLRIHRRQKRPSS